MCTEGEMKGFGGETGVTGGMCVEMGLLSGGSDGSVEGETEGLEEDKCVCECVSVCVCVGGDTRLWRETGVCLWRKRFVCMCV